MDNKDNKKVVDIDEVTKVNETEEEEQNMTIKPHLMGMRMM